MLDEALRRAWSMAFRIHHMAMATAATCSTSPPTPALTKTWVDPGFKITRVEYGATLGIDVEPVIKDPQSKGFSVVNAVGLSNAPLG